MKKVLAFALCLVMLLSAVACASNPTSDDPGKSTEKPAATTAPATGDPATDPTAGTTGDPVYIDANAAEMTGEVRFLTAFAGSQGTDELIADFNKYYPNVKVSYEVYVNNAEGNVTANTAIQSKTVDVILSFDPANTGFRWENGLLMDITDRLAADNLDLIKEWGAGTYKYNDRVYCIPGGGLSVIMALNMDMWNAAGLGEIPDSWTWDEYFEACRKMTQKAADGSTLVYGGAQFNNAPYWYYPMMQTKGTDVFYNAEGKADFASGLAERVLSRQIAAEQEGIWYKQIDLMTNNQKSRDLLWSGTVASCVESLITRFVQDKEKYPHDFILGYAPYPVNEAGETNYMLGSQNYSFFCVTNNAKDPDAAYAFAKFASTYGGKYLYKAGHTTTWTGTNPDEIVDLIFGSRENAALYIDVDSYIKNSLALGQPAYSDKTITAYSQIADLANEYLTYALNGTMTVNEAMTELNDLANQAIEEYN